VMVERRTLDLAALFLLACLGGKAIAAVVSGRWLSFSRPQVLLLFSLSSAQAAATLAATVVGFQLGLFDSAVVNAILVVIFVSVLVSSVAGSRGAALLHAGEQGPEPLGTRIVVGISDPSTAFGALSIARRIARQDGGVVQPVLVVPESAPIASRATRAQLAQTIAAAGVDGFLSTIVDRSPLEGAIRAGAAAEATLVLVAQPNGRSAQDGETAAGDSNAAAGTAAVERWLKSHARREHMPPVAVVHGSSQRVGEVRALVDGETEPAPAAAEMARRVAGGPCGQLNAREPGWSAALAEEDVTFVSAPAFEALAAPPPAAPGMLVVTLGESVPATLGESVPDAVLP
jgi:hypothetical protein